MSALSSPPPNELGSQNQFNFVHTNKPSRARQWRSDLCMYSQLCAVEQHHRDQTTLYHQQKVRDDSKLVGVAEEILALKQLAVEACLYQARVGSTALLDFLMTKHTCKSLVESAVDKNDVEAIESAIGNIPTMFVSRLLHDIGVIYLTVLAHQRDSFEAGACGCKTEIDQGDVDQEEQRESLHSLQCRALIAESKQLTLKSLRELPLWREN